MDGKCCITKISDGYEHLKMALELWEKEADKHKVSELLKPLCECNVLTVLGLTASAPVKCWPQEKYGDLARMLSVKYSGIGFVLLGNSIEQGKKLEKESNVLNLCGQLTLRETVALLRRAKIYVGNDTGLMHMASACDCAVVEISSLARDGDMLYGISSNSRFSPWSKEAVIVQPVKQLDACNGMCQMPYAHCITQVTVEAVLEAACRLLSARGITADESI